jgi:DNA repair photolyase
MPAVMSQVPVSMRGRAARSNDTGRFDPLKREMFEDGWSNEEGDPHRVDRTLTAERIRTIITRNASPDLGFDRTINPYRGCEHGCIYCYARPTHAYLDLSPGLDFETKLFFKPDAAKVLEQELSKPSYEVRRIQLGASTDPYQPIERDLQITRQILDVLSRFSHPVSITTKSANIVRDIDLLAGMAKKQLVSVTVAVTTLDRRLARAMEPRASTPDRRLFAMGKLRDAGIPIVVGVSPIIPGLTDHELDAILEAASDAGASGATYSTLRMPYEIKDLFREWLEAERPGSAKKIISLVRQMHGGKDYDPAFGTRMRGQGPIAELTAQRFKTACARLGLNQGIAGLRTDLFAAPQEAGDQLSLFP